MATLGSPFRSIGVIKLLILFQWIASSAAWVNLTTKINLSWPPVSVWRDIVAGNIYNNSVVEWANQTTTNGAPVFKGFDCARFALDPNVERTDFPITGGMVQLNFETLLGLQPDVKPWNTWTMRFAMGQFSGLDDDQSLGWWAPESDLNYMNWSSPLLEANRGPWCSPSLDVPATINYTLKTWVWTKLPNIESLAGTNATLGVSLVKWNETQGLNSGQMTQCSYIRFTNTSEPLGPCRTPSRLKPAPSPSTTSASPTATLSNYPSSVPERSFVGFDKLIIGVSVAAGVVFFLILFCICGCCRACGRKKEIERQKKREHEARVAREAELEAQKAKGGDEIVEAPGPEYSEIIPKKKDAMSDGDSITIPPPTYKEALDENGGKK